MSDPTPNELKPCAPEHNPDNLTPEQYGAPEWRLLRVGEIVEPGDQADVSDNGTNWLEEKYQHELRPFYICPYRRRAARADTDAELARLRARFAAINGQINVMANAVNGQQWEAYWTASDAAQKVINGDFDHAIGANFEAFRAVEAERDQLRADLAKRDAELAALRALVKELEGTEGKG